MAIALLVSGVGNLCAQTDVTSTYITNPSFELGSNGTAAKLNYGKDDLTSGLDSKIYGWTLSFSLSTSNSNWQYQNLQVYTKDDTSSSGFGSSVTPSDNNYYYFWRQGWTSNTNTMTTTSKTNLAIGKYTLSIDYKGATSGGTSNVTIKASKGVDEIASKKSANFPEKTSDLTYFNSAEWSTISTSFLLEEESAITFSVVQLLNGGTKKNNISRADIYLDNVRLEYENINGETLAAVIAQATSINSRTGDLDDEITTAQGVYDAINNTPDYQDDIDDAISILRSAIETSLGSYAGLNGAGDDVTAFIANADFETSLIFDGTANGTLNSANATATTGSTTKPLNSINAYNIAGWELKTNTSSDYARAFTMPYNNTLYVQSDGKIGNQTITSPTNGSSVTTSNNSLLLIHSSWCNTLVNTIEQTIPLPAGSYRLTFDSYVSTTISNAESRCGISYGATPTTDYRWPSELDTWTANVIDFNLAEQTNVTFSLGYKKTSDVGNGGTPMLFVDNLKLVYSSLATTEDYSNLTTAIGTVEGKDWGFEAGEYAPYNYVEVLQALTEAKAIDPKKPNRQSTVQGLTTTLNGADWSSSNASEVNAVYNGDFSLSENNGAPAGWVSTHSAGLGGSDHARAYVLEEGDTNYDNLEAFGQGDGTRSAFFIRFDGYSSDQGTWYKYGGTDGYKMPLKGSTAYYITLQAGAWGNYANKYLSVTIKDPAGTNVSYDKLKTTKKTSSGEGVDEVTYVFTTTDAGNYTLSFWNENGANYAAIVSNIVLKKATTATMSVKAKKWGTFIAPFAVTIPDGVNAYTVTGVSGTSIVKSDPLVTTIPANTPVVLENTTESLISQNFNGKAISSEDSYTVGLLTGVYTAETIAASDGDNTRYVLQTQEDVQAFYKVTSAFTASPNRCYLTVPVASGVKAFYLDGDETAVSSVKADELQGATIYNLAGQRVSKAQKGVYIINGKKVAVK